MCNSRFNCSIDCGSISTSIHISNRIGNITITVSISTIRGSKASKTVNFSDHN